MRSIRSAVGATIAVAIAACAPRPGQDAATGGTLVISAPGEAEHLFPPLVSTIGARQVVDQVFDVLADVGPALTTVGDGAFRPRLAKGWEWSADSMSVRFDLDESASWHDGVPVRASDVKYSFDLYRDTALASPLSSAFPPVDSVTVVDSLSLIFHFGDRGPERFFRLAYNLHVLPRHLLDSIPAGRLQGHAFTSAPVGSGPFRMRKWDRGIALEIVANVGYFRGRPSLDRIIWRPTPDANAAVRSVLAGESDVIEVLRPDGFQLADGSGHTRAVEYASYQTGSLLFNTRDPANRLAPHPVLGDRAVRRALAMAVDRAAVVQNALDSLARVANGPLPRASWAADSTSQVPAHDPAGAAALLDATGWRDSNGDGIRERGGRALRLTLLVPSVSNTRRQMAVVLQDQLRHAGVDVRVEELLPSALFPRLNSGEFDAFVHVWQNDPSPASLAQAWGGRDLERSSNFGWYANPAVDSALAAAAREGRAERARDLYRKAARIIADDAAAVFLWEPRNFALLHSRLEVADMRGDAWWAGLSRWHVRKGRMIPRDQVASSPQ